LTRVLDMAPEETREQLRSGLSVLLKGVIAQHLLRRTGGDGRIAAVEVLLNNPAVASMIRDNKVPQIDSYLQTISLESGMQGLEGCLLRYIRDGLVDVDEACRLSMVPEVLRKEAAALQQEA
jgi:twitching motility protein PilT